MISHQVLLVGRRCPQRAGVRGSSKAPRRQNIAARRGGDTAPYPPRLSRNTFGNWPSVVAKNNSHQAMLVGRRCPQRAGVRRSIESPRRQNIAARRGGDTAPYPPRLSGNNFGNRASRRGTTSPTFLFALGNMASGHRKRPGTRCSREV